MKLWPFAWFRRRRPRRRVRYMIRIEEIYSEPEQHLRTIGHAPFRGAENPIQRPQTVYVTKRRQLTLGSVRQFYELQALSGPLRVGALELTIARMDVTPAPRASWWRNLLPVWAVRR